MALTLADAITYSTAWLASLEYDPLPVVDGGPADSITLKLSDDRLVLLTLGSGAGLDSEYMFDRPALQVYAVGAQGDQNDAEKLALDLDRGWLAAVRQFVGNTWVLSTVRAGGRPAKLLLDSADRSHYTCSYIIESEAGLDG